MTILKEGEVTTIQENNTFSMSCGCDYCECSCDTDTLLPEDGR